MAHNEQAIVSGALSLGLEWNYSADGYNAYLAPTVWRWDAYDTNNYGAVFDEWITEPNGAWQGYYDYSWGSGSGWRQVDSFATRAYSRGHSAYTVTLRVQWYSSTGTYSGGWIGASGQGGWKDGYGCFDWSVTIPAKESHAVGFDANGGTGAPSGVTKWYGEQVTMPTAAPTRANYEFLGWSESKTAASAAYQPGQSYWTADADTTLYAVWKLVSSPPTVAVEVARCTSAYAADPEGTYAMAVVTWSVDAATVASNVGKTVKVAWSPSTGAAGKSAAVSAKSGTTTLKLGGGFEAGASYSLTASVTDSLGLTTTTAAQRIGQVFRTLDIGNEGKSMGLGAAASDDGSELKIGFDALTLATSAASGTVNDIIVAQGTSGGWAYIKYASGWCMCWGKFDSTDIPWSGLAHASVPFPFTISDATLTSSYSSEGNPNAYAKYAADTSESVDAYASTDGTTGGTFRFIVAGRWK